MTQISANELRIGNYVNSCEINFVVTSETILHLELKKSPEVYGIPITPEWLERFGFEDNILRCYNLEFVFYNSSIYVRGMVGAIHPFIKIKYIHQLQNLYFALTGTELKLKEQ